MHTITKQSIDAYKKHLICEEKSSATVEKYISEVVQFSIAIKGMADKQAVLKYKDALLMHLAPSSVNSAISALNGFFAFCNMHECRIKRIKIQRKAYADKEKELSRNDVSRLLCCARRSFRSYYILKTFLSTGIRVSELRHITAEAVKCGEAQISCKGKIRTILLPKELCKELRQYIERNKIYTGSIFVTKSGKPLDRSNIWKMLKKLAAAANISAKKVFPHNLRHFFAKSFYSMHKDIVRLADILGHSSINTTRIYTIDSSDVHRKMIDKLDILLL